MIKTFILFTISYIGIFLSIYLFIYLLRRRNPVVGHFVISWLACAYSQAGEIEKNW